MAKKEKKAKNVKAEIEAKREAVFGSPVRNLLIGALVSILLGVAFLVKSDLVYTYYSFGIGGLVALVGIVYIILYFVRKPVSGDYRSEFAIGLVALLAGGYMVLDGYLGGKGTAAVGFEMLIKIIGVLIAADGVLKLQYTLDIARMKFRGWWILLILSLLGIALGVLTVMGFTYDWGVALQIGAKPTYTASINDFVSGMMMLGIAFCLNGFLDLLGMIVILVRNHKANRAAAIAAGTAMVAAAKQEELDGQIPVPAPAPVYTPAPAPVETVVVPAPAAAAPAVAEPVLATPPTEEK